MLRGMPILEELHGAGFSQCRCNWFLWRNRLLGIYCRSRGLHYCIGMHCFHGVRCATYSLCRHVWCLRMRWRNRQCSGDGVFSVGLRHVAFRRSEVVWSLRDDIYLASFDCRLKTTTTLQRSGYNHAQKWMMDSTIVRMNANASACAFTVSLLGAWYVIEASEKYTSASARNKSTERLAYLSFKAFFVMEIECVRVRVPTTSSMRQRELRRFLYNSLSTVLYSFPRGRCIIS